MLDTTKFVSFGGFGPGGDAAISSDESDDERNMAATCFTWFNDLHVFDSSELALFTQKVRAHMRECTPDLFFQRVALGLSPP